MVLNDALLLVFSYLAGCFTSGYYLVAFLRHTDLRATGNGSVGARNAYRVLGAWGFLAVATLDLAKGMLGVWVSMRYGTAEWLPHAAAVAVVMGHVWPAQLHFRGGKGVMAATGGLLVLDPILMLSFIGLMMPMLAVLRRVDISGLIVVAFSPVIAFVLDRSLIVSIMLTMIGLIVLIAHRDSLKQELGFGVRNQGRAWEDVGE